MKQKYVRTDYINMLKSNLNNAALVAKNFDRGHYDSSTLFISIIRTLVYDTKNSVSLLERLDDKNNIDFIDTTIDHPSDAFHLHNFLYCAKVKPHTENHYKLKVLPKFYFEDIRSKVVNFDKWWNEIVIIIEDSKYSRKNIILILAHKHGILHSDTSIDATYYDLLNNVKSFAYHTKTLDIENPETEVEIVDNSINSIIRQIAHELIVSLINHYDLKVDYGPLPKKELPNFKKQQIYDLSIAINKEFEVENKDIIRKLE